MSSAHGSSINLKDFDFIYEYISEYGAHIALWVILSGVTVYRREISCNRSYHKDDEEEMEDNRIKDEKSSTARRISGDKVTISIDNEEPDLITEKLSEGGAGLYRSGQPILNFAALFWLGFGGCGNGNKKTTTLNDLSPEDLLDRVGNYASPDPIMAAIAVFMIWMKTQGLEKQEPLSSPSSLSSSLSFRYRNHGCDPLWKDLPPDVHVHIASFLHPRDVLTLSCVSNAYHSIIDDPKNMTSAAVWKTLWERDYAWIVFKWKIGKQALERSNCKQWVFSKDFYFLFGQSYLDYVLAGHNTFQSCLVGIHSNIYDITPFLFSHPGTPDTLMVHSGRDATSFFDDMGHSVGARKLAMSMCVVVNRSAQSENNECGLFPTTHTKINKNDDGNHRLPPQLDDGEDNLLTRRTRRVTKIRTGNKSMTNGGGTLHQMQKRFLEEREQVRNRNTRKYSNDSNIIGHEVNTYFDPFTRNWRIWYTDTDLQTIYLPAS